MKTSDIDGQPIANNYRLYRLAELWTRAQPSRELQRPGYSIITVTVSKMQNFRRRARAEGFLSIEIDALFRRG